MTSSELPARHAKNTPTPGDLFAGLSVALIAVPQALAYAELAGMPAYTGLYAMAAAAMGAAFFVSSPYLQAGPVATTSLLTLGVLSQVAAPGTPEYVGAAGLLALVVGAVRVLIGVLRLGSVAYLMSHSVLLGFTSAAGVLICASQLPTALGVTPPQDGVLAGAFWSLMHLGVWRWGAVTLSVLTVAVILLGRRVHKLFPGVLVAVLLGLGYSLFLDYGGATVGAVPAQFTFSFDLPWGLLPNLLVGGAVIALVGFSEASSIARTYATLERQRWSANREFLSQGAANLAAGLVGGFPVGGSFSRSAINRTAGAKTRWSGAVTGLAVLAVLPFAWLISPLPKASLAAIVIAAVLGFIKLPQLYGLWHMSRPQALLAWTTFGLTLVLSPRIDLAVLVGVALAIGVHLWREQNLGFEAWLEDNTGDSVVHVRPHGVLWFGSAYRLEAYFGNVLSKYPDSDKLVVHLAGLGRVDLNAALVLKQLTRGRPRRRLYSGVGGYAAESAEVARAVGRKQSKIENRKSKIVVLLTPFFRGRCRTF